MIAGEGSTCDATPAERSFRPTAGSARTVMPGPEPSRLRRRLRPSIERIQRSPDAAPTNRGCGLSSGGAARAAGLSPTLGASARAGAEETPRLRVRPAGRPRGLGGVRLRPRPVSADPDARERPGARGNRHSPSDDRRGHDQADGGDGRADEIGRHPGTVLGGSGCDEARRAGIPGHAGPAGAGNRDDGIGHRLDRRQRHAGPDGFRRSPEFGRAAIRDMSDIFIRIFRPSKNISGRFLHPRSETTGRR